MKWSWANVSLGPTILPDTTLIQKQTVTIKSEAAILFLPTKHTWRFLVSIIDPHLVSIRSYAFRRRVVLDESNAGFWARVASFTVPSCSNRHYWESNLPSRSVSNYRSPPEISSIVSLIWNSWTTSPFRHIVQKQSNSYSEIIAFVLTHSITLQFTELEHR
jgi:hypothetical protein